MKLRPVIIISIFLVTLVLFGISLPAQAAPSKQGVQFATATPLPDGRIMYKVQAGDSCIRVALLNGITVEQLRQLNTKLDANCTLTTGQLLLIGTGGPSVISPTPGPSPTPLPPTITPTPFVGTTQICVLLFNDINGDGLRQLTEPVIVGGAVSVTETNGKFSDNKTTAINSDPNAYEGVCFNDVPEGHYNISVAIPDNYNPTTALTNTIDVKAGDRAFVPFGAQSKESTVAQPTNSNPGGGTSPILGIFGGILLLGGVGLGWYALRLRKPESKLRRSGLLKK